jgi:hypothetical protein
LPIADFLIDDFRLRLAIADFRGRIDNQQPQSTISNRKIGNRQSATDNRQSAIGNRQ